VATEVAKVGVFREMTNICREISEKLNISVHTVNRYRQNILRENTRWQCGSYCLRQKNESNWL